MNIILCNSERGCGPVACDASDVTDVTFDCWECCKGWVGEECHLGKMLTAI